MLKEVETFRGGLSPHDLSMVKTMSEEPKNTASVSEPNDDIEENEDAELTREDILRLRDALIAKRAEVVRDYERHVREASEDTENLPDEMDIAERQSRHAYLFRLADKEAKLLREIDRALAKVPRGTYGICEGTQEPIGLRRLTSRPWTRYSVEHTEMLERQGNRSSR